MMTAADLEAMARISHIMLSDEEKRIFPDQINEILSYIDKLEELDTDGVEPTAFIHMLNAIREHE
jgi:aspartyl-tRNA(Asn)/glutamyl-tRNA(Gln) amidotransferase subunit C